MRYKKKPVVIEAVQWDGTFESYKKIMEWANKPLRIFCLQIHCDVISHIVIESLSGPQRALPEHWIIKGALENDFYPCDPVTFKENYEAVV